MIVEDTTEDMGDVKISIMKICPYTLQEKSLQEKKIVDQGSGSGIRNPDPDPSS